MIFLLLFSVAILVSDGILNNFTTFRFLTNSRHCHTISQPCTATTPVATNVFRWYTVFSIGLGPFVWVLLWCDWQISERLVEMCQNRWGLHLWPIIQQFTIQQKDAVERKKPNVQKKTVEIMYMFKSHHVCIYIYYICINVHIYIYIHVYTLYQHVAEYPHDQII